MIQATLAPRRVLIVSAADATFGHFLKSLLASLQPVLNTPGVTFACFDIGLNAADRRWLDGYTDLVRQPGNHLGVDASACPPALRSFLARPFLPGYFPGYDVYVWIDADIWLQDPAVVDDYVDGALACGMALAHEQERAYRFQTGLFGRNIRSLMLGYEPFNNAKLLPRPPVNAGFLALSANAPQWETWLRRYEKAIRRNGSPIPHDRFMLNHTPPARDGAPSNFRLLDPVCNWLCARSAPMWDDSNWVFCKPYPPYEAIRVLHLAGPAKRKPSVIRRTKSGTFRSFVLRGSSPENPVTDLAGWQRRHQSRYSTAPANSTVKPTNPPGPTPRAAASR